LSFGQKTPAIVPNVLPSALFLILMILFPVMNFGKKNKGKK